MNEWQPVATAPKDGNSFIVWMQDEQWFATVRWVTEFEGDAEEGWLFDDDILCDPIDSMHGITGWFRPTSPEAAQALQAAPEGWVLVPRGMLEVAACPNSDCVDGCYPAPNGDPTQCQWCDERNAALAAPSPSAALQAGEK